MPLMWGDELAQRLAIVSPQTKVIFISGHSEEFLHSGGTLSGNEIFFPKPFCVDLLLKKIRELLGIEDPVVPEPGEAAGHLEESGLRRSRIAEHPHLHMESDRRVE
jgi:DNA-binding response OmpR family regulator